MNTSESLRAGLVAIDAAMYRYGNDTWSNGPWCLEVAGRAWAVATDGKALVAVQRDLVSGDLVACPPKVESLASRVVVLENVNPRSVNAGQLAAFAGVGQATVQCETCDNRRFVTCDDCDGVGGTECECLECGDSHDKQCRTCDSNGEMKCRDCSDEEDNKTGQLLTAVINLSNVRAVWEAVKPSPESTVLVSLQSLSSASGFKSTVYLFRPESDERWLAVMMPMAEHVKAKVFFDPVTASV